MPDAREAFVAGNIAQLTGRKAAGDDVYGMAELRAFLDDPSTSMLQAFVSANGTVRLVNKVSGEEPADGSSAVSFLKLRPEPITQENIHRIVQVNSMQGSPLVGLYHSLHSVYAPLLLRDSEWRNRLGGKAQTLIADLDATLTEAVRGGGGAAGDLSALSGILTPTDEFQFWATYNGKAVDREAVRAINLAFEPIRAGFAGGDSLEISEVEDLVEATYTALDDCWKVESRGGGTSGDSYVSYGGYPQLRMAHLFDVAGAAFCRILQTRLSALDVWNGPFSDVGAGLAAAAAVLERWGHAIEQLTGTLWPTFTAHRWEGGVHTDAFAHGTRMRFEEVLRIRTTHEELGRLLPVEDSRRLTGPADFSALAGLSPLSFNPYTQAEWAAAIAAYDRSLAPVEATAAAVLRRAAASYSGSALLLLGDLQKSAGVLRRPGVAAALLPEREALLRELTDLLGSFEAEAEEEGSSNGNGGRGSAGSGAVGAVHRLRQLTTRAQQMVASASHLLQDLPGFRAFRQAADELAAKLRRQEASIVADWQEEVGDDLQAVGASMRGRLLEINTDGVLVVNYSERLITLLREGRQLTELGHAIPSAVAKVIADGERFYRYGVMLKKVANFYNNMDTQIIAEQRPMLLEGLLAFEAVVTQQSLTRGGGISGGGSAITWGNPVECENYVERLQVAADALSLENRRLRKVHAALSNQVCALMNVDLLRQRDLWKARWSAIKEQVDALRTRYPVERMKKWMLHWEQQVYKALEAGYQMGLESLSENLGELRAELVVSARCLQLQPPIEEVRTSYYREMRRFVAVPSTFEGLGFPEVYRTMPARNAAALTTVYEKAEDLFRRLSALQERYQAWVALGAVDLDAYVEEHVSDIADYDLNFRVISAKRKDAERLPEVVKLDCIVVSLAPLKSAVNDQLQQLGDTLLLSVRKRALADYKAVDAFLEDAQERLCRRPKTVAEIGVAKREWKAVEDKTEAIKALSARCLEMRDMLLQHAPGSAVDTSEVSQRLSGLEGEGGRWDNFTIAFEAFGELLEEQKESLRGVIEEEVMAVRQALEKFGQRWQALKPQEMTSWAPEDVEKVFAALEEWRQQFEDLKTKMEDLKENCVAFGMPPPHFEGIAVIEADLAGTSASWGLYKEYSSEIGALAAQDWIGYRATFYSLQDVAARWAERAKARVAELQHWDVVCDRISGETAKIKQAMPALKYCRGDAFKEEHWSALLQGKLALKREVRLENLTLGHFLSALDRLADPALVQFVKQLQARAQGEVTIREALQELIAWSQTYDLKLVAHDGGGRPTSLIKDWKDLFVDLGDKQGLLASLKESHFFKAFEDQGLVYEEKMSALESHLQMLNQIQRKWLYLEPILAKGALPAEQGRFRRVDDEFRGVMAKVEHDPKLFLLADEHLFPGLRNSLSACLDQLERCQKALSDFLEAKRGAMPRFYFIGDDDLLEILGQSKNPAVIQAHLRKLFQGIHHVEFGAAATSAAATAASSSAASITSMVSSAGEEVRLEAAVKVTDRVDQWLEALAGEMKSTLGAQLTECLRAAPDYERFPSQVMCVAEQIKFCDHVEAALSRGDVASLLPPLKALLQQYTSFDLSSRPLLQLKIKALVLDLIHNMDVLRQLMAAGTRSASDWAWQKQLRYYLVKGKCEIRMSSAAFDYTYEYQGNAPKLVHTPLTDRCYLTLTQGMHMGFGGNPYGPAGTGKTESVKALAQAFGRQVLVFNCDEGIDFQSMGRIFIGLVKCGAWGCFDEFNRLKEDQLSAISQQIQNIQDAIKAKQPTLRLLNRTIDVDFNTGIFVTLNPAGKEYGGRSRLPDNLKALFRPVAMGQPDNELIAEVILYSEGFGDARDLASKVVSLFRLSRQLLSRQRHYDWGLRALKAALNTGGKLIQEAKRGSVPPDASQEREILIKAVRVNTLPKLTHADGGRFLDLIEDTFPGVASADMSGGELEAAIREVMAAKPFELEPNETQVRKMLQLKEALDQRMGCVVVGRSGCGKTTLWSVLRQALARLGTRVVTHVMNPKSMPRARLLGKMDMDTREWTDGVLTAAARKAVREMDPNVRTWVVCDGDVDPEWIENLNSVLDDNHLLTLPSGERLSLGSNVNFLFETHDLRFASPATVSRMGMIYLSEEDVNARHLVAKWLRAQPEEDQSRLNTWLEELFFRALESVLACEQVVDTTAAGTIANGLSQLPGADSKADFALRLIRGLGGNLALADRAALARDVFESAGEAPPVPSAPLDCGYDRGSLCQLVTTRDTLCGGGGGGDGNLDAQDLEEGRVVPTVSVQRTLAAMRPWIDSGEPFVLVGPEGSGKDMVIRHAFASAFSGGSGSGGGGKAGARKVGLAVLHCSAQTTAEHVISRIAQACALYNTPEGRAYRPRDCDRLVLFLKDINLPRPDKYDSCMLVAFLQQLLTHGGFYDASLEFLRLERVQIVASMNAATTVGRHPLSTRFVASVRVLVVDYPDAAELAVVYDVLLEAAFACHSAGRKAGGGSSSGAGGAVLDPRWTKPADRDKLARMMVEIFHQIKSNFSVDDQRHYLFTPRDLTAWVRGLLRYDLSPDGAAGGGDPVLDSVVHEAQRLFRDRLVDAEAAARFDGIVNAQMRTLWRHSGGANLASIFFSTLGDGVRHAQAVGGADADAAGGSGAGAVPLERVPTARLRHAVAQGLEYYEREERELRLLLSDEALSHVARIDRVLSSPGGHLLLVGRAGVGRRQATALAAYMQGYRFATPLVGRSFGLQGFRVDLKAAMQAAGVEGIPVVLYVEEHHLVEESVLETINSLLSAGEVPGLYTAEELEPMLAPLRESMLEEGRHRTMNDFFVSRVKKFLHVALAMDPLHPLFPMRCESNPALTQRCACLWLGEWGREAMRQVPRMVEGVKEVLEAEDPDAVTAADSKVGHGGKMGGGKASGGKRAGSSGKGASDSGKNEGGSGENGSDVGNLPGEDLIDVIVGIHKSVTDDAAADGSDGGCVGGGSGSIPNSGSDAGGQSGGATPLEYVALLRSWLAIHEGKKVALSAQLAHLSRGLGKLSEASGAVDELSKGAAQKQRELQTAQTAADRAMDQITSALGEATVRRGETEGLKKELAVNERAMQARKADIEAELSEIQPILDEAQQAVGQIKSDHINEIRSLKMPPEPIADVLGAVLMLLGVHDTSWLSMKKFLGNRGVKEEILGFDAHRIDPDMRAQVSKVLKNKASSFEHATIYRVSVAAAPMAAWVKAQIRYSVVLEKIQPLEEELGEAVTALEKSQQRLSQCEDELAVIDKRVADLKQDFSTRTREAEKLAAGLERAQGTLDKAQALVGQLAGEQHRWRAQATELGCALKTLPRHALLAAATATYLGAAPEARRERLTAVWSQLAGLAPGSFSLRRLLSSEGELLSWKGLGLPTDQLSQENALVVAHSGERVPFVVDPGGSATAWLRRYLSGDSNRPLEEVSSGDARFQARVELAVRFGKTLLVTDADGLEPVLFPLARRDLALQGPRHVVQIGDKMVDYNAAFRMVLVTRDPDPDLPPAAAAAVVEVNFTVTRSGLEGQLLGVTIQSEQPELEKAKSAVLKEEEDFKVQLAQLEEALLDALATAEGDLLENTGLMESLARTKCKAADIQNALDKSARASEEMDRQREAYLPFARTGSTTYFLVQQLQATNPMYKFSLASFVRLFRAALADPAGMLDGPGPGAAPANGAASGTGPGSSAKNLEGRLNKLVSVLVTRVLHWVGRAIFKADRPMFALHLAHGVHSHLFGTNEWEIFTGQLVALGSGSDGGDGGGSSGPTSTSGGSGRHGNLPAWAASEREADFRVLSERLPRMMQSLELDKTAVWQRWATSPECENDFPAAVVKATSHFQRVLVVQALRPDRLQSALQQFACDALRVASLSPPAAALAVLAADVDPQAIEPILLVTTTGADPGKDLEEAATEAVGRERYHELAMGGGQEEAALAMLRAAAQAGDWLSLKNLHLMVAWLPALDKELSALAASASPGFRLWLTTDEHGDFPAALLQRSLKVTYESPPGLKKNLQRTYGTWGREMIEGGGGGNMEVAGSGRNGGSGGRSLRARLLFVLAWFHAVVQERRTFIPQGWTKFYEFSSGDLRAGTIALLEACERDKMSWETVRGLMRDAIYGGRIDEPNDMRVLSAFLRRQFDGAIVGDAGGGGGRHHDMEIAPGVRLPDGDLFSDYLQLVASLPEADAPAAFGLPGNIERTAQRTASALVVAGLRRLSTGALGAQKYDRERWRIALGPVLELWERLTAANPGITKKTARKRSVHKEAGAVLPVAAFVGMEETSAGEVCAHVDACLLAIKRVVYGTALLTPAVAAAGTALVAGEVPAAWRQLWQGPDTPQAWLGSLVRKTAALGRWGAAVAAGRLLDSPVNLGDLFNPNTFLNAVRQQTARTSRCAMDTLRLASAWDGDGGRLKGAALPVVVEGLQLQGAAFLGGLLQEAAADDPELVDVPALTLAYLSEDRADRTQAEKAVRVPLYASTDRETLLVEVSMPAPGGEDKWVLAGAALFLKP